MSKTDKTKPARLKSNEPDMRWMYSHYTLMCRKIYGDTVPKWYVDHQWWDVERTRERDNLSRARRLYNSGEMDDGFDFANHNHHHSCNWYW